LRINPFRVVDPESTSAFDLAVNLAPVLAVVAKPYAGGSLKFTAGSTLRGPSERELRYDFDAFSRRAPRRLIHETHYNVSLEHTHTMNGETSLVMAAFLDGYGEIVRTVPRDQEPYRFSNSGPHLLGGTELELRYAPGTGELVSISGYLQDRVDTPRDTGE
jgi:hypothetical protein